MVAIRRSKTDQEGEGETVGLPYGSDPATCPVRAYRAWLAASGIAAAWRESAAAGIPLSGAQLAERFGRSPRWGRQVIAECREAADPVPPAAVEPERHEGGTAQAAASPAVWRAWLLSLSVDGLVIAASMSMLVRRRAGLPAGALAWCALLLGVGASLAANVAAAEPTVAGRLVAAWPPLALLLAYELAMQQARTRGG